jgi:hypothetical protein
VGFHRRARRGVAFALVGGLLDAGRPHFEVVRLRVPDARAAAVYEAIGFRRIEARDATHALKIML